MPGNNDERNLGRKLFKEFFDKTDFTINFDNATVGGLASSESLIETKECLDKEGIRSLKKLLKRIKEILSSVFIIILLF